MLAPVTHILPLTTIRRERVLPIAGKVVVRAGQKVLATDVIAEARIVTQHLVLDISRGLGGSADQVDRYVTRKVGEEVSEGDIVAGPVGLFPRVVRAPRDGRVVAIGGGQVLLELEATPYELRAGIAGQVVDLIPDRGAVIETTGALIQGVWGNGLIDGGTLSVLARNPDDELAADRMDVSMRGTVIVAGPCVQAEILQAVGQVSLRGLILPSIPADLIPVARKLPFPLILLEGFGRKPFNSAAFQVLSTNDKRDVTVNANPWQRYRGERPEIVISLPATGLVPTPREVEEYSPGQVVRVHRSSAANALGTLSALRPGQSIFPSGIHAPAAEVHLENGEQVLVPLSNLEVIT
jgi:hypothetical protein